MMDGMMENGAMMWGMGLFGLLLLLALLLAIAALIKYLFTGSRRRSEPADGPAAATDKRSRPNDGALR